MTKATLGERVLLVPQTYANLTNPHVANAIGKPPHEVKPVLGDRATDGDKAGKGFSLPTWVTYTSTLVRKGYGVMVVRDGKLDEGPSDWDTGD